MKFFKPAALIAAAAICISTTASASLVWTEMGADGAGDSVATAQATFDSTYHTLDGIHGNLTATTAIGAAPLYQVDLYKIRISDFNNFSASTGGGTAFDTALYLFNDAGMAVYMNDDNAGDSLSTLPAGDAAGPSSNGVYYLAIAFGGYVARDASSLSTFLSGSFTDVLGGDPTAGALASWAPSYDAQTETPYSYDIALTGATTADLPEPGSLAMVLSCGVAGWLSRRATRKPSQQATA